MNLKINTEVNEEKLSSEKFVNVKMNESKKFIPLREQIHEVHNNENWIKIVVLARVIATEKIFTLSDAWKELRIFNDPVSRTNCQDLIVFFSLSLFLFLFSFRLKIRGKITEERPFLFTLQFLAVISSR